MIYYIDIDGTICETPVIDGVSHYEDAEPLYDRIDTINDLYRLGHTIVYWTARGSSSGIDWQTYTETQLKLWGCVYTELKFGKPTYDIWVDDKAFNSEDFFETIS